MRACLPARDGACPARWKASRERRAAGTARAPRRPYRPPGGGQSPDPPRRHCAAIDKDPIGPHARNLPPEERLGGLGGRWGAARGVEVRMRTIWRSRAALRLLVLVVSFFAAYASPALAADFTVSTTADGT